MNLKRLLTSSVFSSTPIVGDSAKIRHESKNILYYMICTICGEDYVGQTKDFRKCMNNHKSDIRGTPAADTLGADKHIHYCQLQKYSTFGDPLFRVIPFLTVKDQTLCECLEKYYIRTFYTAFKRKRQFISEQSMGQKL